MRYCLSLLAVLSTCSGWVLQSPYPPGIAGVGYGISSAQMWQNNNSFDLSTIVLRWGMANLARSDALGGGITWAIHPDFCEMLMPQFPEKDGMFIEFLNCDDLRAATSTAFSTWSMNNPHISFDDVTAACMQHGVGNGTNWTCADAELVIQPSVEASVTSEAVAWVEYNLKDVDWQPLTTAGVRLRLGIGIREASMKVSTNYCWYLDATFCYHFFRLQEQVGAENSALMIRLVSVVSLTMAAVYLLLIFWRALRVSAPEARQLGVLAKKKAKRTFFFFGGSNRDDDDDGEASPEKGAQQPPAAGKPALSSPPPSPPNELSPLTKNALTDGEPSDPPPPDAEDDLWDGVGQCEALVEYLATMPAGPFLMCSFWLIFLPTFYIRIFLPCWDCHDYEATMAHEIGHVLGFTHPNEKPDLNLRATASMGADVCKDALNHVEFAGQLTEQLSITIMHSITQHLDKTCLTTDDVEGLNFLYPFCDHPDQAPKCIKPRKYSGLLRLAVSVMIPFLFVAAFMLVILVVVRRSTRIQLIGAKRKMTQKLAELTAIQNKLDEAELALIQADAEKQKLHEMHANERHHLQREISRAHKHGNRSKGGDSGVSAWHKRTKLAMAHNGKPKEKGIKGVLEALKKKEEPNATPLSSDKFKNAFLLARAKSRAPSRKAPSDDGRITPPLSTPTKRPTSARSANAALSKWSKCRRGSEDSNIPSGARTTTRKRSCMRDIVDHEKARHLHPDLAHPHALPPLPEGWTEHETADGRVYYFCKAANKSTWARPVNAGDKKGRCSVHALPEGWQEMEEHTQRRKLTRRGSHLSDASRGNERRKSQLRASLEEQKKQNNAADPNNLDC